MKDASNQHGAFFSAEQKAATFVHLRAPFFLPLFFFFFFLLPTASRFQKQMTILPSAFWSSFSLSFFSFFSISISSHSHPLFSLCVARMDFLSMDFLFYCEQEFNWIDGGKRERNGFEVQTKKGVLLRVVGWAWCVRT